MKCIAAWTLILCLATGPSAFAAETWKGSIGDKMCGADHHGQDPVQCTVSCVQNGSPYVFVIDKARVLDISNQKDEKIAAELAKHAGRNVEVTGTLSGDGKSVKIDTIRMPAK